jgi:metal-sulfur cluster biosynthetic enzyme
MATCDHWFIYRQVVKDRALQMCCQSYDDSLYTKHTINYNGCPCQCDIQRMSRSRWNTMEWISRSRWNTMDVQVKLNYNACPDQCEVPRCPCRYEISRMFRSGRNAMNVKVKVKYNGCPSQGEIQRMSRSRWYTTNVHVKVIYSVYIVWYRYCFISTLCSFSTRVELYL